MAANIRIEHGDCREVIKTLADASIDAVVTDPPYGLEFMGKEWDASWQVSSKSPLFGKRKTAMPGFGVTRNPNCRVCGGRLRGAKRCDCAAPNWDEAPNATRQRQMSAFQDWCQEWAEQVFRVLKPGAHLVAFGGTRTYHRLVCAIEDAGFEIRDQIGWAFGSGFPKSHDVSKGIDKAAGAEREIIGKRQFANGSYARDGAVMGQHGVYGAAAGNPLMTAPATDADRQWQGWGTALKPAWEPICLARKPLAEKTVAANVLAHGTGALNIDGCRIEGAPRTTHADGDHRQKLTSKGVKGGAWGNQDANLGGCTEIYAVREGRWPANLIHDGSAEVLAGFPDGGSGSGTAKVSGGSGMAFFNGGESKQNEGVRDFGDLSSAARFFYTAKADADDRLRSRHPTVKPVDLMAYLVRLITPPGGTVLDPFAGSGSTGMACMREGFDCLMIEREAEYVADIRYRLEHVDGSDTPLFTAPAMAPGSGGQMTLFDPYADGWPDAAANSKGCYDVAIEALREQFVKDQSS